MVQYVYKTMFIKYLQIVFFAGFYLFSVTPVSLAQEIPVMNFDEFESRLHRDNDTTYLINFWATWCQPCVEEIPAINELARRYAGEKFSILLVSLDFPSHIDTRLTPFIERYQVLPRVILLHDPDFDYWIRKVHPDWSGAIPATLIYRGGSRSFYEKPLKINEFETIINQKLNRQ